VPDPVRVIEVDAYARLAGVYDEIVVDPCFPLWAAFLHARWQTDDQDVHDVLDVCCGTGLMAAALTAVGYRVVGVDASPAMLARARQLLGAGAELSQQTLPDLTVEGPFDAAISTFDGLNYLTIDEFNHSLTAIADVLRPGGWLIFDLHTDGMLDVASAHPTISGETAGIGYTIHNVVDSSARTCESRIEVAGAGDAFSERHFQYFHSDTQVRDAIRMTGLELIAVVDEYSDEPAMKSTLRATWIARRPTWLP
jgi:predicted TPR repeat methyltransferase